MSIKEGADMAGKKTTTQNVFKGNNYRITVLSERLIRFEYNVGGEFLDWPTEFAMNRNFPEVAIKYEEDSKYLELEGKYFALLYQKEKPYEGPKYAPDINLKVVLKEKLVFTVIKFEPLSSFEKANRKVIFPKWTCEFLANSLKLDSEIDDYYPSSPIYEKIGFPHLETEKAVISV